VRFLNLIILIFIMFLQALSNLHFQDETEGTIVLRNGDLVPIARQSKDTLAHHLLDYALEQLG
jgi:hypothetical protein